MSRRSAISVVFGLAFAMQSCLASSGVDYDFNNLNATPNGDGATGAPLAGQDGWFQMLPSAPSQGSAYVEQGGAGDPTPAAGNAGPSFNLQWFGADARPLGTPLQYTHTDTAAVFMVDALVANSGVGADTVAAAGPVFRPTLTIGNDPGPLLIGLALPRLTTSPAHTYLAGAGLGDPLLTEHWYQIRAVTDFAVPTEPVVTLSYRALSEEQTTFTTDSILHNIAVHLPSETAYYAYVTAAGDSPAAIVDNLHFSAPIPEPSSAMAMLVAGTILLLWPRRIHRTAQDRSRRITSGSLFPASSSPLQESNR